MTSPVARFLLFAGLGWAVENLLYPPRYSRLLPGIPLLPVYGVGGIVVDALAPSLRSLPVPARAAVYAGSLAGLELLAGALDRAMGGRSWSYGPDGDVVDLKHAVAWGALGLVAEALR